MNSNITGHPWLVMGDFNIIRFCREKLGGTGYEFAALADFNKCIEDLDIEDCPAQGIFLT